MKPNPRPDPRAWASVAGGVLLLASGVAAQYPQVNRRYWSASGYVEYLAGNAPIVLTAPHGGYLAPPEFADRKRGVVGQDTQTQELARRMARAIGRRTGRTPHLIICHLHRRKLDANRDLREAAQGDVRAERVWHEFHRFVNWAKRAVVASSGAGHYFDIHGHRHPVDWVEIGYNLWGRELAAPDDVLRSYVDRSAVRTLGRKRGNDFAQLVRGASSLGALLSKRGFRSVPSPRDPFPGRRKYYRGGYNTRAHGSLSGGVIDGTQLEHPRSVRRDASTQTRYARAFAEAIEPWFLRHHRIDLRGGARWSLHAKRLLASERGEKAQLRIVRSGDVSHREVVQLSVSGTAESGVDFTPLPRCVVFAPGMREVPLTLVPIDDAIAEPTETVTVALRGGAGLLAPTEATVVLSDNDSASERLAVEGSRDFTIAFEFRGRSDRPAGRTSLLAYGERRRPGSVHVYLNGGKLQSDVVFRNALVRGGVLDVPSDGLGEGWHTFVLVVRARGISRVWIDGRLRAEGYFAGDELVLRAGEVTLGDADHVRRLRISSRAWTAGEIRRAGRRF